MPLKKQQVGYTTMRGTCRSRVSEEGLFLIKKLAAMCEWAGGEFMSQYRDTQYPLNILVFRRLGWRRDGLESKGVHTPVEHAPMDAEKLCGFALVPAC